MKADIACLMCEDLFTCVFCEKESAGERLRLKERMFGLPGEFAYVRCPSCEALRIETLPTNLADYYPSDYYSFEEPCVLNYAANLKWRVLRRRDRYEWTGRDGLGRWISRIKPNPQVRHMWPLNLRLGDRILDVGCGQGAFLRTLRGLGFRNLFGVDPFIAADIREDGLSIRKCELEDIEGEFEAIMIHHALEHMADHVAVFRKCREILAPNGLLLVRVPTVSCEAWSRYGTDWYQLDAPRHLVLHSRKSIELLARQTGLSVLNISDDSCANQFIVSELYRLGLPMVPRDEETRQRIAEEVAKMPVSDYQRESERLNREGRGDQISVLMRCS